MTVHAARTDQAKCRHSLPLISVYVPTRNRAHLLLRALESVFSQTYTNIELLVVDDASDDETPTILKKFAEAGRLRNFRLDSCRGAPAARNLALREATGDLVTGIDDDDVWFPDRLSAMVTQLRPDISFVAASDVLALDDNRHYIMRRRGKIELDDLLQRNVVGNQVLARRSDILQCGGFDESLPAAQDYDLWIRLAERVGPGLGLATPLQIVHTQTSRKRISTSHRRRSGLWRVYQKHAEKMSRNQKKTHLFNIIRNTRRPISLRTALTLANRNNAARVGVHYLSRYLPRLDRMVIGLASWRDHAEVQRALAERLQRRTD